MTNEVQVFSNGKIDLPVKEVGGHVYFEAEAAAIGLGISRKVNGKDYPRWERVNNYLCPLVGKVSQQVQQVGKGVWITETQFYKLAFKASNDVAEKFQDWVASEVLPSIRKHGMFATEKAIDQMLADPDSMIKVLTELKKERESRLIAEQQVHELSKKTSYLDIILGTPDSLAVTQIANDYGMSAVAFNRLLQTVGIQHKVHGQWVLYKAFMGKGYTQSKVYTFKDKLS